MVRVLPEEIETSLPFRPNEHPTHYLRASYLQYRIPQTDDPNNIEHDIRDAAIILTDHRLILIGGGSERRKLRKKNVPYSIIESLDYRDVIGIWLFREKLTRGVTIKLNHNGGQSLAQLKKVSLLDTSSEPTAECKPEQLIEILNNSTKEKHRIDSKRETSVQIVLDFSFLKTSMENGGIVVSQIKCPSCGGTIGLPSSGTSARCPYCKSEYHAQDVFDKIKGLMKDA